MYSMHNKMFNEDELSGSLGQSKIKLSPIKYGNVKKLSEMLVNKALFPIIDPDKKLCYSFNSSYYKGFIAREGS